MYDLSIAARTNGSTLLEAVRADQAIAALLDPNELDALLDIASHTGRCAQMVDRVLAGAA